MLCFRQIDKMRFVFNLLEAKRNSQACSAAGPVVYSGRKFIVSLRRLMIVDDAAFAYRYKARARQGALC